MFLISIILILVIFYFQPLFTSPTYAIFNKTNNENKSNSVPIIFVFAVSNVSCKWGFPDYIKISLEQAILTQPNSPVILASNFEECPQISDVVDSISKLIKINIRSIVSSKTLNFMNNSHSIFQVDHYGELWMTAAYRFFHIEDIMRRYNYKEVIHVEADNLLYGDLSTILPTLRDNYKGITATPLDAKMTYVTASVMWISSLAHMENFNNYLLDISFKDMNSTWGGYIMWLRPRACCKKGGFNPDEQVNAIYDSYVLNRYVINMSEFAPGGTWVGQATGNGIWDSNSWGQYLGGTHQSKGRNHGFTDPSHISGQAMRTTGCKSIFICSKLTNEIVALDKKCYMKPLVQCGEGNKIVQVPLWNLHVHSKNTRKFQSDVCECPVDNTSSTSTIDSELNSKLDNEISTGIAS